MLLQLFTLLMHVGSFSSPAASGLASMKQTVRAPPMPSVSSVSQVSAPPLLASPVGGRLKHFTEAWTSLQGATPWHLRTMQGIP